jgi:hypothetical protein
MVELTHMEIKILDNKTIFLKGKKENILVNPNKEILENNKYSARTLIFTGEKFDDLGLKTESVMIRGPGEYEIGGLEINGYSAGNGNSIYLVNIDGLTVGILGDLEDSLSEKRIEKITGVDILLAPVKIKEETSAKLILDCLIPVGWTEDESALTKFLDAADQEGLEKVDSLKVEKDNLPDGLEIKVLKKV